MVRSLLMAVLRHWVGGDEGDAGGKERLRVPKP